MRILLVDDEEELAEPLQRVLTNQGYVVDIAN
ncbi:MAG: DNA-binding response regulator, partial [Pseudanabaena sp.]